MRTESVNIPINIYVKHAKNNEEKYLIKIGLPDITYSITPSLTEILENETKILSTIQALKLDAQINIPKIKISPESHSKTANSIESFFRFLLDNESLLSRRLISFLQIPNPYKKRLMKKISKMTKFEELNVNNSYSSQFSRSQFQEESEFGTPGAELSDKHFCVFFFIEYIEFNIKGKDHYEFVFLLSSMSRMQPKQWSISRRYNDFVKLEEILKKEAPKRSLPKLPGKQIFHNEENLNERSEKLEKFLRIILNETVYLSETLMSFIDFHGDGSWNSMETSRVSPKKLESKNSHELEQKVFDYHYLKFPMIKGCYKDFVARDFESKVSLEQNEKQFLLYAITIEEAGKFKSKILKRYTDFENLHQALQTRFKSDEVSLPELPGKLDFFVNTQIKSRGERLIEYLNQLFAIESIEDCFTFRKFIGIEIKNLTK